MGSGSVIPGLGTVLRAGATYVSAALPAGSLGFISGPPLSGGETLRGFLHRQLRIAAPIARGELRIRRVCIGETRSVRNISPNSRRVFAINVVTVTKCLGPNTEKPNPLNKRTCVLRGIWLF